MHRPPAAARPVLRQNRARYQGLVENVRRYAEEGDLEHVLRSATLAAHYGWQAPGGLLSDPGLERLVVASVRGQGRPTLDSGRTGGRVLHVLTQAYGFGGHTRLAWRWISRDPRRSDVALTDQADQVPEQLLAAVAASGGRVHDLRSTCADLTARAQALRSLMDGADAVVHHVHPHDVVALAAANIPGPRPPIVHENHAEHTYWVGVGGAELVSDYHAFSRQVSSGLRGVPLDRLGLLPIPLTDVPAEDDRQAMRDAVRSRLGLRPDAVLGLTVSAPHKISPMWGRGMAGLLDRTLRMCPRLTAVLVGPPPTGEWADLARRHPGRVHALGPRPDVTAFYAAADLYLDSYPSRSGTAVLEAALHGVPVLSLADLPEEAGYARLYQADSPGLAANPRATNQQRYVAMARSLVADAGLRAQWGTEVRAAVLEAHCGEGWGRGLEALYDQLTTLPVCDLDEYGEATVDDDYGAMLMAYGGGGFVSPTVTQVVAPLGEQLDDGLQTDLVALAGREDGPAVTVRSSAGWADDLDWTARLLALAGEQPRLAVSLPFIAGDDAAGSRTTAVLLEVLAGIGQTPEDCGAVSVDSAVPAGVRLTLPGELPCTADALDRLDLLLRSPLWTPAGQDAGRGTELLAVP